MYKISCTVFDAISCLGRLSLGSYSSLILTVSTLSQHSREGNSKQFGHESMGVWDGYTEAKTEVVKHFRERITSKTVLHKDATTLPLLHANHV